MTLPTERILKLSDADCDHLLAALEWAINHEELRLGPGLHRRGVDQAARKIEAVADLARQGIAADPDAFVEREEYAAALNAMVDARAERDALRRDLDALAPVFEQRDALRSQLEKAEARLERVTEAADRLFAAFIRMPDAGLGVGDPRWDWWNETISDRAAYRAAREERE